MKRPFLLTLSSSCSKPPSTETTATDEPAPVSLSSLLVRQLAYPSITCNIFIEPCYSDWDCRSTAKKPSEFHHWTNQFLLQPCGQENILLIEDLPHIHNQTQTVLIGLKSCSIALLLHLEMEQQSSSGPVLSVNVPIVSPNIFALQLGNNGDIFPSILNASFDLQHVHDQILTLDSYFRPAASPLGGLHDESMIRLIHTFEQEFRRNQIMDVAMIGIGILSFLVYVIASYSIVRRSSTRKENWDHRLYLAQISFSFHCQVAKRIQSFSDSIRSLYTKTGVVIFSCWNQALYLHTHMISHAKAKLETLISSIIITRLMNWHSFVYTVLMKNISRDCFKSIPLFQCIQWLYSSFRRVIARYCTCAQSNS